MLIVGTVRKAFSLTAHFPYPINLRWKDPYENLLFKSILLLMSKWVPPGLITLLDPEENQFLYPASPEASH